MPLARSFNKLNGDELRKIILRDVEQALSRDDTFRQHLTYLEFGFDFRLDCQYVTAPNEPLQETTAVVAGGRQVGKLEENKFVPDVPADAPRERLTLTRTRRHSSVLEPPDKVRQDTGLHIPRPQLDPTTNTIVDIPRTEVQAQQVAAQRASDDHRSEAVRERDQFVAEKGINLPRVSARPVQELARDVTDTPTAEVRGDIHRADRIPTELPPEHVVLEETEA